MSKNLLISQIILFLLLSPICLAFEKINIDFHPAKDQPYFVGIPEINIDAEEFNTLILRMKSNKSGTARLFWATNFDPQLNESKSVWFFLDKSNNFKEYVFNLSAQNPNWIGFAQYFLLFPEGGRDGIEIESSKVIPGNLITNIKSGWREFWGPRGRLVIGSTINTIQPSNLFGKPIYLYIYWVVGLITVGYFCYLIFIGYKAKKRWCFENAFPETGKVAFLATIFFWSLLEVSSLFNNWLILKDDLKYYGKSYRDKLVLANTGDFYPFIEFCEANLPPNVKFDMRIPPFYNDIRARYYLYPREMSSKEAEYLIVYDMEVEKEVARKFKLWKLFRNNAYIMRKK